MYGQPHSEVELLITINVNWCLFTYN